MNFFPLTNFIATSSPAEKSSHTIIPYKNTSESTEVKNLMFAKSVATLSLNTRTWNVMKGYIPAKDHTYVRTAQRHSQTIRILSNTSKSMKIM